VGSVGLEGGAEKGERKRGRFLYSSVAGLRKGRERKEVRKKKKGSERTEKEEGKKKNGKREGFF